MADEAFRPQKRSISQDDIDGSENASGGSDNASETLSEMASMRQRLAEDVGKEVENPSEGSGMRVSGKVPEEFKQVLAQKRMQGQPRAEKRNAPSEMRVTGSGRLEELIAGIGAKGGMIYEQ